MATDDTPTGRLTKEQVKTQIICSMRMDGRIDGHELARRIEEIVRKNISAKTEPVSKAFVEAIRKDAERKGRDDTVNGTLMAMEAACKGAADRARKEERERAAKIAWEVGDHDVADAILQPDEPDDRDACDRGDP